MAKFQTFKPFNRFVPFNSYSILPRDAGEEEVETSI